MKIVKIITIATGANAFILPEWSYTYDGETSGDYDDMIICDFGLTTTLEPESLLTKTIDGEFTLPDLTTTTMAPTELISTTNTPSSELGPIITIDVIDDTDKDKTDDVIDEPDGGWWSATMSALSSFADKVYSSLPCWMTTVC